MFVFRLLFWFPLAMAAIPANPADLGVGNSGSTGGRDISALRLAASDLAAICESRPAWCGDALSLVWRWKMSGASASIAEFRQHETE